VDWTIASTPLFTGWSDDAFSLGNLIVAVCDLDGAVGDAKTPFGKIVDFTLE
jgi:hypothetical protein